MRHYYWTLHFEELYDLALKKYQEGVRGADNFFDANQIHILEEIGSSAQEIYDFAEDAVNYGEPDRCTAVLVAAVRRDYFFVVQNKQASGLKLAMEDFPGKEEKLEGIVWLPRIIQKAQAKLEGRMPLDMMYGCGGDRAFFKDHDLHPADFLREVWAAKGDAQKILAYVRKH